MTSRLIIFLIINFAALGIGGLSTTNGVSSDWYLGLDKAPWTPPGWVFGAAWTTIMIAFSIYLAYLWPSVENRKMLIGLFAIQFILNVAWNPIFFSMNQIGLGLITISALTILVGYFLVAFYPILKMKSALLLPYFVWLLIATSLNAYILVNN
ncbi:MAG: TspO/MBR family protein [Bacteroidia bacterium]